MKNKVTAKVLRKAAKRLHRKLKREKPYKVEVENPKVKTDFLRIITKEDLFKSTHKTFTDNEGNTKLICVKPTLLI